MSESQVVVDVPAGMGAVSVTWDRVQMCLAQTWPCCTGEASKADWRHEERMTQDHELAAQPGRLVQDVFSNGQLRLRREVWTAKQGGAVALRHVVTNTTEGTLSLDELCPLHCVGKDGLVLDASSAGQWEVLRQARLKNEIPTAVRLGTYDADYEQAMQTVGEQGDPPAGTDGQSVQLQIDPVGIVRPVDPASDTHLLIGFLSQTGHLAQVEIETDETRQELARLSARSLFDGCELPAGGERASQWVLLMRGDDSQALLRAYADHVGQYHGVVEPTDVPPSVWCSWYYYGPYFYEEQLHRELACLKTQRLPFDVLLIDDSRPRPWGDWLTHAHWPSGMKDAASRIRDMGYRPGIWTCPYLARADSELAKAHPDWLLKQDDGQQVMFQMDGTSHVLDPTHPEVDAFFESLFHVMTHEWGFTYHKLDFMRSVFMNARARFVDRQATRLEAYRRGLEAIRRGAGADAYISVCGGHYGGSIGLADSQRSGSDVVACWDDPPALPMIKQNLMRTWMNRLWHTDADAMMVRRRAEPINDSRHGRLSLGMFTDDEARSIAANQYVGGGILCASESFTDIQPDRLALYRHVMPAIRSEAMALDPFRASCPSHMLNRVVPRCEALGRWATVTVFNWEDESSDERLTLSKTIVQGLEAERYLVFEFFEQRVIGLYCLGEDLLIPDVPPHGCRVLRIVPWDGERAVLAGTDLHFSGGGVEIAGWQATSDEACGEIDTPWPGRVNVTVAFPESVGYKAQVVAVDSSERIFALAADVASATMQ